MSWRDYLFERLNYAGDGMPPVFDGKPKVRKPVRTVDPVVATPEVFPPSPDETPRVLPQPQPTNEPSLPELDWENNPPTTASKRLLPESVSGTPPVPLPSSPIYRPPDDPAQAAWEKAQFYRRLREDPTLKNDRGNKPTKMERFLNVLQSMGEQAQATDPTQPGALWSIFGRGLGEGVIGLKQKWAANAINRRKERKALEDYQLQSEYQNAEAQQEQRAWQRALLQSQIRENEAQAQKALNPNATPVNLQREVDEANNAVYDRDPRTGKRTIALDPDGKPIKAKDLKEYITANGTKLLLTNAEIAQYEAQGQARQDRITEKNLTEQEQYEKDVRTINSQNEEAERQYQIDLQEIARKRTDLAAKRDAATIQKNNLYGLASTLEGRGDYANAQARLMQAKEAEQEEKNFQAQIDALKDPPKPVKKALPNPPVERTVNSSKPTKQEVRSRLQSKYPNYTKEQIDALMSKIPANEFKD